MSKLGCPCGHVIVDQTDRIPYKARLLSDEDDERFWTSIAQGLAELCTAIGRGERQRWVAAHFLPGYPADVDDLGLIHDFVTDQSLRFLRDAYQCQGCGRVHVAEGPGSNQFRSFAPDVVAPPDLLASKEPPE